MLDKFKSLILPSSASSNPQRHQGSKALGFELRTGKLKLLILPFNYIVLLTDNPAELRQHTIRLIPGGVPAEVRLDYHRWPDPVNQLLVTCKLLRVDVIWVMSTWSFDSLISRSVYIRRLPRFLI